MPDKKPIRVLRVIARLNVGGPAIQAISLTSELLPDRYQTMLVCGQVGAGEGNMAYMAKEKGVKPVVIPELGREILSYPVLGGQKDLEKIIKRYNISKVIISFKKQGTEKKKEIRRLCSSMSAEVEVVQMRLIIS
jgi:FlaA1/EpsC-like NDP-sugar epimerase